SAKTRSASPPWGSRWRRWNRSPPASPAATRPPSPPTGPTAANTSSTTAPGPRWAAAATRPRRRSPSRTTAQRFSTPPPAPAPGPSAAEGETGASGRTEISHPEDAPMGLAGYWVRFPANKRPQHGDSGGPVWNLRTGASIGLISAGRPCNSLEETLVAPLLHPPNMSPNRVPGILHHVGMQPLSLKLGG